MSKTQQIRDALAAGPLAFRKLHEQIGGDDMKLRDLLFNLKYRGQVKIGNDEDKTVSLRRAPPPGQKQEARRQERQAREASL